MILIRASAMLVVASGQARDQGEALMRGLAVVTALMMLMGSAALAQEGARTTKAPPIRLNFDLPTLRASGEPELRFLETTGKGKPADEVSWQRGALGLGFRQENGRIKGGVYLEASRWRFDLRPLNSENPLETNGLTLRLSTKLGD